MDNKPPFRLFELPGNQQMAGWVDASAEDPVLHLVMQQKGIRAPTQMNFNNPPGARPVPPEATVAHTARHDR